MAAAAACASQPLPPDRIPSLRRPPLDDDRRADPRALAPMSLTSPPTKSLARAPSAAELFTPKLITVLREGYGLSDLRADLFAGLTVAIVALPLSMAIAIASGVTPLTFFALSPSKSWVCGVPARIAET